MARHTSLSGVGSTVAGRRMERSLAAFEQACLVLLSAEQGKLDPDTSRIAQESDAVRLSREYEDVVALSGTTAQEERMTERTKLVVVLYPDGRQEVRASVPTWAEMRALVGGFVEQVRVLDRLDRKTYRGIYTYMYVNEDGFSHGLPRNQAATQLYQCTVRLAFPGPQPFRDAAAYARREAEARGIRYIDLPEPAPGYTDDPWIAGVAIYFQGWTCKELDEYWNREEPA